MVNPKETLILDLVAWLAAAPRPYAEVMDLWRTSCPRLTVWEDATERGLIACETRHDALWVVATPLGSALLDQARGGARGTAAILQRHGAAPVSETPPP